MLCSSIVIRICNHLLLMNCTLRSANDVDDVDDIETREVVEFPAVMFTEVV